MFSRAVRRPYPLVSPPLTMLIFSRIGNGSFATSYPATHAWPEVGSRRVDRILIRVVFPAPFGPRSPKSSPSRICVVTLSRAVTGPSGSPPFASGFFFRRRSFRGGLKIRTRSLVSIANAMVKDLAPVCSRGAAPPRQKTYGGSGRLEDLTVAGHIARDPVPHPRVRDVGELGDLLLVVLVVVRELRRVQIGRASCRERV